MKIRYCLIGILERIIRRLDAPQKHEKKEFGIKLIQENLKERFQDGATKYQINIALNTLVVRLLLQGSWKLVVKIIYLNDCEGFTGFAVDAEYVNNNGDWLRHWVKCREDIWIDFDDLKLIEILRDMAPLNEDYGASACIIKIMTNRVNKRLSAKEAILSIERVLVKASESQ